MNQDLRYPIGKFEFPKSVSDAERDAFIQQIADAPRRLRQAVQGLSEEQLDTPYRPEGWTVRQVVHHLPDSHMNSYTRFKLAATENEPTIKPFDEGRWAELTDAKSAGIEPSLQLLEALHARWVVFLRSLGPGELSRKFHHPELGPVRLDQNIALYAWHGRHHVAQIEKLREREGWK